jgi:hypothetical protein
MSQKSSLPQAIQSVSTALMPDRHGIVESHDIAFRIRFACIGAGVSGLKADGQEGRVVLHSCLAKEEAGREVGVGEATRLEV